MKPSSSERSAVLVGVASQLTVHLHSQRRLARGISAATSRPPPPNQTGIGVRPGGEMASPFAFRRPPIALTFHRPGRRRLACLRRLAAGCWSPLTCFPQRRQDVYCSRSLVPRCGTNHATANDSKVKLAALFGLTAYLWRLVSCLLIFSFEPTACLEWRLLLPALLLPDCR